MLALLTTLAEPAQRTRFLALFETYAGAIERLSRGYERDPQRRRDLEQDIWAAAFRAFSSFEGRASERTFLYRVAHNVAATHLLRRRRERSREAQSSEDDEQAASPQPDTERSIVSRAELRRLMGLVHALKPADRQLVLLSLEGLDRAEIAEITGVGVDNVSVRLSRLRSELARQLGQGEQP